MNHRYVIAIDQGTTSSRAILFDENWYSSATHGPFVAAEAKAVALSNRAGGKNGITIKDPDIEIGYWRESTFRITDPACPPPCPPNATKTTARRDSIANAPLTTFFAKLLGIPPVEIQATAVAALSKHPDFDPEDILSHGPFAKEGRGNGEFPGAIMRGTIPSLVQ